MRDTNGQIYWNFATAGDLLPKPAPGLVWDAQSLGVGLQPSASPPLAAASKAAAELAAAAPRIAVDAFGTWAIADDELGVRTAFPGAPPRLLWSPPLGLSIVDLDWTAQGHLIVALRHEDGTGEALWIDTLGRFDPVPLAEPGFAPDRIAASAGGGPVWLVDRATQQIRRIDGTPIPDVLDSIARAPGLFTPKPDMADPARLDTMTLAGAPGDPIIEAAADASGALILLRLPAAGEAVLEYFTAGGERHAARLSGVVNPHAMAAFGPGHVAIACAGWAEARVFAIPDRDVPVQTALGARLPLRHWTGGRFCAGASGRAHYPVSGHSAPMRRLAALSYAAFATSGETLLAPIDSGVEGFVWHRLYLEAFLPAGTAVDVYAAAADSLAELPGAVEHRHRFGAPDGGPGPRGAWIDAASERPWARPAGDCQRLRDKSGLFSALVQRCDSAVNRRLCGRYLRLRLVFSGPGSTAPRLHALRVWGPRYSWRDRHLPELYAQPAGPGAAGSDFLDRYLALFEGLLTPIEGEIATVWRLANPATIPSDGLDWLASWLGLTPDTALGEAATRRLISNAARLSAWRGTLRGLTGMLDIASAGGVAAGRIVVIEHFRMQRTFATILGADLSDRFDPLTRGSSPSGQSMLGPGFFLGAEDEKRLFALFRPELAEHPLTSAEDRARAAAQLASMVEEAAHRVTVLVHEETDAERRALLARVVTRECPAHVVARLQDAPGSLILGLSALLGVETRLSPAPETASFQLDETHLGQARLRGTPALDNRI